MVAIGIIAGCGIVISYLLVRLYRQKKEIYDFTEELQRCLTLMKDLSGFAGAYGCLEQEEPTEP